MVNKRIQGLQAKGRSRAYYRVQATREMFAGKRMGVGASVPALRTNELTGYTPLDDEESPVAPRGNKSAAKGVVHKASSIATIEFACASYRVIESVGTAKVTVMRTGNLNAVVTFKYHTEDGTAKAGEDYIASQGELTLERNVREKDILIKIIDDNVYEPDESFYVVLHDVKSDYYASPAELGSNDRCSLTIIDDDFPGILSFKANEIRVVESAGVATLLVERTGGSRGRVSCSFRTQDESAVEGHDYEAQSGELVFNEGEALKEITIKVLDDSSYEKDEMFKVVLEEPKGGAMFGYGFQSTPVKRQVCEVTIQSDDQTQSTVELVAKMVNIPVNVDAFEYSASSWADQFVHAFSVNGADPEAPPPTASTYVVHFVSLFFKVAFAFIPPTNIMGGWLTFVIALAFIGGVTAVIGDVAAIFGCCLGVPGSITAITFVAMGTSLPDTFASKKAAVMDEYADASIVNVTGSNAVNVLLGLGLPWMLGAFYWARQGPTADWVAAYPDIAAANPGGGFVVRAGDLVYSVSLFVFCALICLGTLSARRLISGYELGGAFGPKLLFGVLFITLWGVYVGGSIYHTLIAA